MKKNVSILALILLIFSAPVLGQGWNEIIKVAASDRAAGDYFGYSVAISGDYAIVGAYRENEDTGGGNTLSRAGSAYILYNNAGTWEQMQKIVASDRAAADWFGYSVAISGDYAIIGAYQDDEDAGGENFLSLAGSAYIFYNNSGTWEQKQKIVASDRAAGDRFGYSVSINGDYAIIGAYQEDEDTGGGNTLSLAGSAYIFYNNSETWEQKQKIVASDRAEGDWFGNSVSISGDYAIVGANYENEDASGGNTLAAAGSAYIFYNNSGTWEQNQKIVASDRAASDFFGISVSISGDYAIVGAYYEDEDANGANYVNKSGSAYIFYNNSGTWEQNQKIVASDRNSYDNFGFNVSINGDYAIVGAWFEDHDASGANYLQNSGSAYIFYNNSGTWEQNRKIVPSDRAQSDNFGYSVSISGNHVLVGAYQEDEDAGGANTLSAAGSAYIFSANPIYVDKSATGGSNDGSSWTDAYTLLQPALDDAAFGDEIWVAKGTYYPTEETDGTTTETRRYSFQMIDGVEIYGGFAGTETAITERSNYSYDGTNETILSGDFNNDDVISGSGATLSISGNTENTYHIFDHPSGYTLSNTAILDGFTLKGGNANGSANPDNDGGAMYNQAGQSPAINNCYFIGNRVSDNGGAYVSVNDANVNFTNCTFTLNYATDAGGAIANYNSDPTITNCLFFGNRGNTDKGGAIYNYGPSDETGGSNTTIINSTIAENASTNGGGIYNQYNSNVTIINSIVYGNTVSTGTGPQIRNRDESDLTLSYSDIEGGIASGIYSTVGSETIDGGGNIDSDPKFVGSSVNSDHPYLIYGISACTDAGNNSSNNETYDIRGNEFSRKLNKIDGSVGTIDIGAYEYDFDQDWSGANIVYVNDDASGNDDGSNWNDAYVSLQDAITNAGSGDQIWIAAGTYFPEVEVGGTGDRYKSFQMKNDVEICGGFAMTEQALAQRTDYGVGGANETILSGDIGTPGDISDNCYHVFSHKTAESFNSTAVLDGVTLTKGNANGDDWSTQYGGGMLNYLNGIALRYVTFYDNSCVELGGGIYVNTTSATIPTIEYCNFFNNASFDATNGGGGIYHTGNSLILDNCIISNNTSTKNGGGIYSYKSMTLNNCTISNNSAQSGGGAIHRSGTANYNNCIIKNNEATSTYGGGIYHTSPGILNLTNCLVFGNSGGIGGGGLYSSSAGPNSIVNCTFVDNSAGSFGGGGLTFGSSVTATIKNSIVYGNTSTSSSAPWDLSAGSGITISYSNIWGCGASENWAGGLFGIDGGNNIDTDPKFVGSTLNAEHPYSIFQYSACADVGDNDAITEAYDIRGSGYDRKLNKTTGLYKNMLVGGIVDMGAYEYKAFSDPNSIRTLTWDGNAGSDWADNFNWNMDNMPGYPDDSDNIVVPNVTNDPVIAYNGTATCNNLSIESGASLTIQSTGAGTGSLIVNETSFGNITAERYLTADYWHYLSSPVGGQILDGNWLNNNNIVNTPSNQFYRWDEDTDYWIQYGYIGSEPENFGDDTFLEARGYAAVRSTSDALEFVGTVKTSAVNYPVTIDVGGNNLLGNPYPSTIAITENAQATDNFLADNASLLDNDYQAVYIWNETEGYSYGDNDYKVICNTDFTGQGSALSIEQDYIQPGQAFMVKVKQAGNIVFNTDIRKHGTADYYKSKKSWPGLELRIANSDHSNSTIIAFNEEMTLALDPSYDVVKFKGNPNLALYSQLIENTGKDYAVQALPNQGIENYIIPIGVDVSKSSVFEFSVYQELLDGYNITLEDRQENTFTNLRWDTYFATISESGTGRFYLHFKDATAIGEIAPETKMTFRYLDGKILITNPDKEKGNISLVNISGQVLARIEMDGNKNQEFSINQATGIYIINVQTEKTFTSKKIIIK